MAYRYKAVKVEGKKRDEHRVIVELHLGRPLLRTEVVHHINGNKMDNRPANLEVMLRAEHSRMHQIGRRLPAERVAKMAAAQRGKRNANSVLSDEAVKAIRAEHASGIGSTSLAKKYGMHKATVIGIVKRRRYSYVA